VIVARNLGRSGERVDHVALSDFDVESVDMLTLVMIGNCTTRSFGQGDTTRTYTPRGYEKKMGDPDSSEE
jgi:cobalt-precorrin 5A hydrolase/precorrin-3B C17-methyltransferase